MLTTDELIAQFCAPEGGEHRNPVASADESPGLLATLLWPLGVVCAIAAAAVWMH